MLFGTNAEDPTDLLLVPEGMEGAAVLPDSLATVPACVFSRCLKLSAIEIPTGSTVSARFATRNGTLYTSDIATLVAAPAGLGSSATIAPECVAIAAGAFWGNTALDHIVAPGKVASVAMDAEGASTPAFSEEAIENAAVTTSERDAWIAAGFTAFADPAQPGAGAAPDEGKAGLAFTLLDDHTLSVHWQGESLTIPDIEIPAQAEIDGATYAVSEIADDAFRGQNELTWIRIPAGVTRIGSNAFSGCSSLTAIDIPSSVSVIGQGAFLECEALVEVQLPAGLHTIGSSAFRGCSIEQLVLPPGVSSIGDAAFADCSNLATILALGHIQYVSSSALQGNAGVGIYTPYREGGDYTWAAGAPAGGNHLLPYGVKASEDALVLEVGASSDLFADGGYAYTPADVALEFSYKAATVSVDAEGIVVGKQPGTTTVDILAKWNGTTLATATRLVKVTHTTEAVETEEGEDDPTRNSASAATSSEPSIAEEEQTVPRPDIFKAEMPLTTPATQERPEIITGEYQLGTDEKLEADKLSDSEMIAEDYVSRPEITTEEVLFPKSDSDSQYSEDTLNERRVSEQRIASEASIVKLTEGISVAMQNNEPSLLADEGDSKEQNVDSRATEGETDINFNGGTAEWFWMYTGATGWDWSLRITGADQLSTGNKQGQTGSTSFQHHGGAGAGANGGMGYFHCYRNVTSELKDKLSLSGQKKFCVKVSKVGYTFTKWTIDKVGGDKLDSANDGSTNALGKSIYANWQANEYTITFDRQGGSGGPSSASQVYDSNLKAITATPSKNGYTFQGYYTGINGTGTKYYNANGSVALSPNIYKTADNLTLYAYYTPIGYTISINTNTGSTSDTSSIPFTIETSGISIPVPERKDYTFAGWRITGALVTSGQGSTLKYNGTTGYVGTNPSYTAYAANTPIMLSLLSGSGYWGNATFTAMWRSTVTLRDNRPPSNTSLGAIGTLYYYPEYGYSTTAWTGVSIEANKANMVTNSAGSALASAPSEAGYTFSGFYTSRTGGTQRLTNACKLVSNVAVNGATNWYAHWTSIDYTITLDPNGGTMPSGKSTTITYTKGQANVPFYSTSAGVSDYAPKRSDATFVGWRCVRRDSTITNSWATSGKPYSNFYLDTSQYGNYELCAVWYYRITLNGNAPSVPQSTTVSQSLSTIYFYTEYGYRTTLASAGNAWPTSGFLWPDRSSQPVILSSVPTCSTNDWIFAGYYPSRRGTNLADSPGEMCITSAGQLYPYVEPTGNTTWYAAWKGATYTITLKPNPSGSSGATQSKTTTIQYTYGEHYSYDSAIRGLVYWLPDCSNNTASGSTIEVPIPTKAGWTFAGYYNGSTKWYDVCSSSNHASSAKHLKSVTSKTCPSGNFELTAKWVRNITLNANTGTMPGGGSTTTMQIEFGKTLPSNLSTAQTPASPTGIAWTFDGYYSAATGGTTYYSYAGARMYNSAITTTTPTTLYAHWRRFVTVQFNNDNNGVTASPLERLHIIKGTTPPNITAKPTATGYTLMGYYTQYQGGTKMYDRDGNRLAAATDTSVPETLWAQWEPDVQISFRVEHGFFQKDGQQVDTLSYDLSPSLGVCPTLYPRANDGYEFDGWYDASGAKLSSTQNWTPSRPASGWVGGTVYTAKFKPIVYTITYRCSLCGEIDNNAATDACKHIHDLGDLPKQFTIEDIEREDGFWIGPIAAMNPGYSFVGWEGTLESDNDEGSSRVPIASLGNKTLIARVVVNTYSLTLDAGEGTWAQANPSGFTAAEGSHTAVRSFTVETAPFVLPQPALPGYSFSHWECNGERFTGTFTPGPSYCANKTLTAVWSADPYQITYQLDDELGTGTLPEGEENPCTYSAASPALELPIPVRIGYDFLGWTEESVSDEGHPSIVGTDPQIDVVLPAGSWGNRLYKAHWRPHKYNVEFDLVGGAWDSPQPENPIEATYDQDVNIPASPKRAGYFFTGWQVTYETATGTVTDEFEAGETVSRANWVAVEGEPAREGVPENKGAVVRVVALWTANLSFEVAAGAEGVHMGIAKKAMSEDPFELTTGTATLRNLSDGPLKVVKVEPSSASDYNALKAEALQLFRQESNLQQAAFTVRPSRGNVSKLQIGRFGIADRSLALTLVDDMGYGSTTPNCARNWFMEPTGDYGDELSLIYQLDMGALGLTDVDLTRDAALHVADLKYTVALIE